MSDETLSAEPGELETPAIAEAEPTTPEAELPQEAAIGEGEAGEETEDEDDLDFGFKKYRVPKSLKENVEKLQATFTQKTQATAAKERELEERAQRIAEATKASEEEMQLRVQAHHVRSQIEAYEKYTPQQWQELKQTDHNAWVEHRMHLQALRDASRDLDGKLSEADRKRTHEAQTSQSKRIEQAEAYAASKLKGWNANSAKELVEFAVELGGKNHKMDAGKVLGDLQQSMSPLTLEMLYLARIGNETLKKQAAPTVSPTVAPLEVLGAKRGPTRVDLAKADMDSYVAARKAQMKANGR